MSSYTNPNDVTQYATDYGLEWPTDPAERSAAILRATRYLDSLSWRGRKSGGRDQERAWPRIGVTDGEGYNIPENAIPREVVEAAKIFAIAEASDPEMLTPTVVPNEMAMMERVGPVSVQYRTRRDPQAQRPIVMAARDLIAPFLQSRNSLALTRA